MKIYDRTQHTKWESNFLNAILEVGKLGAEYKADTIILTVLFIFITQV
jgi:hypothetical protein